MTEPRYLLSTLAAQATLQGVNVLQYDHPGQGDSPPLPSATEFTHLHAAFTAVMRHAASAGLPIGVLGYGIGNLLALDQALGVEPTSRFLLAPHFKDWSEPVASHALQHATGDEAALWPMPEDTEAGLQPLWRVLVGEPIVPSQPCAPLPRGIVAGAKAAFQPALASSAIAQAVIVSDDPSDRRGERFASIDHEEDAVQPCWTWNAAARARVAETFAEWLTSLGETPRAASTSARLPGTYTDNTIRIDSVQCAGVDALLYRPAYTEPELCLIYEPGVPGQRVDIHCCGQRLAQAAARSGLACVVYDCRGQGLSGADFETVTWSSRFADHTALLDNLQMHFGLDRIVAVGNSAGARVALKSAQNNPGVAGLVLWGPILKEPQSEAAPARVTRAPSGRLATEYCGLWLGLGYNIDERDHDYLDWLVRCDHRVRIVFAEDEQNAENHDAVCAIARRKPDISLLHLPGQHGFHPGAVRRAIDDAITWASAL